jgi:hypothetical protein
MPFPTVNYEYQPMFGVDRWKDIDGTDNGGAEFSDNQLIVTQWGVDDKKVDPATAYSFGDMLVPRYARAGETNRKRWETSTLGRVGSKFFLQNYQDAPQEDAVCAVLNPPQELKQQLAFSAEFDGGDVSDPDSYTFLKPQQGQFAWKMKIIGTEDGQNIIEDFSGSEFLFGQYLPINTMGGSPDPGDMQPFLKTSGADGVAPEPFDQSTEAGINELIAAVNRGDFFIPLIYEVSDFAFNPGAYGEIWWPYSASRG